jgi:hypothetical protein
MYGYGVLQTACTGGPSRLAVDVDEPVVVGELPCDVVEVDDVDHHTPVNQDGVTSSAAAAPAVTD